MSKIIIYDDKIHVIYSEPIPNWLFETINGDKKETLMILDKHKNGKDIYLDIEWQKRFIRGSLSDYLCNFDGYELSEETLFGFTTASSGSTFNSLKKDFIINNHWSYKLADIKSEYSNFLGYKIKINLINNNFPHLPYHINLGSIIVK